METLRKHEKRNTRNQNITTEMKNEFCGLVDWAQLKKVCECKKMSIETFNAEMQNEKRMQKVGWTIQELWNSCNRCNVCVT